jgi:SagB-type dehydrogenase family enzyme
MDERHSLKELSRIPVGQRFELPLPREVGDVSVEQAIARRRSIRDFAPEPPGMYAVANLLWAAQGVTSQDGRRAAPSAGARYPLETYFVCEYGLFHYLPGDPHAAVKLWAEDLRARLAKACLGQRFIAEAPLSIIFAAVYERTASRYGDRGTRYVHMDVGHAAENVHLQAEALGLGSVPVGAFDDEAVAAVLRLPAEQEPLYLVPVGVKRRQA